MKLRADEQGRLASIELFPPNALFDAVRQADGSVRVEQVADGEVPLVKMIRSPKGFLMLPVKLDNKQISAAIRADRDAQ